MPLREPYKPGKKISPVKRFLRIVSFAYICFVIIRLFFFESYSISGSEMLPGTKPDDLVLANRFWNGIRLPVFSNIKILDFISAAQGDLVFIKHPWFSQSGAAEFFDFLTLSLFGIAKDMEVRLVRVLAVGGDRVRISADGRVYVSGKAIQREKTGLFESDIHSRFEIYTEGSWLAAQAAADEGIAMKRIYPLPVTNQAFAASIAESWIARTLLADPQARILIQRESESENPSAEYAASLIYTAAGDLWYQVTGGSREQLIQVEDGIAWLIVPKGMLFVANDFRDAREDSRSWGPVREETIVGIPFLRYWPLARFGTLD
ncbi:MAG: S26 family signal peptidase [Spirochaetota bacterium]|jgi:signal peptidase I|nr:S26 family signal peptidase [Spirochaetota bacterium]